MEQLTVRKTYKRKLMSTPAQELGRVLGLCRHLYNMALEQRLTAWRRCRISLSRYQQAAELKEIRAASPEYAAPECGTSLRRDHNAAKNRERAGQARRGGAALVASENRASTGAVARVECPTMEDAIARFPVLFPDATARRIPSTARR
jgi:hypothetical protein